MSNGQRVVLVAVVASVVGGTIGAAFTLLLYGATANGATPPSTGEWEITSLTARELNVVSRAGKPIFTVGSDPEKNQLFLGSPDHDGGAFIEVGHSGFSRIGLANDEGEVTMLLSSGAGESKIALRDPYSEANLVLSAWQRVGEVRVTAKNAMGEAELKLDAEGGPNFSITDVNEKLRFQILNGTDSFVMGIYDSDGELKWVQGAR